MLERQRGELACCVGNKWRYKQARRSHYYSLILGADTKCATRGTKSYAEIITTAAKANRNEHFHRLWCSFAAFIHFFVNFRQFWSIFLFFLCQFWFFDHFLVFFSQFWYLVILVCFGFFFWLFWFFDQFWSIFSFF